MIPPAANPEFVRNLRAQLRPGRVLAAAGICLALSLVAGVGLSYMGTLTRVPGEWGRQLASFALTVQLYALLLGGGIACLHAIQREKDANTFDFQRVTRLTPRELALGKLFGAPAMAYIVVVCLMPAVVVGAVVSGMRPDFVLAAAGLLVLGAICYHAFALMISLLVERGAATVAVIVFLGLVLLPMDLIGSMLALSGVSPWFVTRLITETTWVPRLDRTAIADTFVLWTGTGDVFFGWLVHHAAVLAMLYLTFTAWFLLPVVRNIKRDPSAYELYTPGQALGLALTVNLILIGFFRWSSFDAPTSHQMLLGLNASLFMLLGLVLLRNRDRLRRIGQDGKREPAWLTAGHPAPYVFAGTLVAGLAAIAAQEALQRPDSSWGRDLAVFKVVFVALWLARDVLFLQWMTLRRGTRRIGAGLLYLGAFYGAAAVLVLTLGVTTTTPGRVLAAAIVPGTVLGLTTARWIGHELWWMAALIAQLAPVILFLWLLRRSVAGLDAAVTR